jgi:hypothetical protein
MKVVRIVSIIIAIVTVIMVALPAVSGADAGKDGQKSSSADNILVRFQKARAARPEADKDQMPPLVKEAKAYALYINPPPKPPPVKKEATSDELPGIPTGLLGPRGSSGQIKLLATCVNQSRPELSVALIDLPGEGFKWVRQSGKAGRLTIKEIKDGLLVMQDGGRTYKVQIEQGPAQVSLVKGKNLTSQTQGQKGSVTTIVPVSDTADTAVSLQDFGIDTQLVTGTSETSQPISAEEAALSQKFLDEIDLIMASSDTNEANLEESMKKIDELMLKSTSEANKVKPEIKESAKQDVSAGQNETVKKTAGQKPDVNNPNSIRRQLLRRKPTLSK